MNEDLEWLVETVQSIPKDAKFVTRDEMTPDGFVFTSKPFNDGSSFSISELISAREEFTQQDIGRKVNTLTIDLGVRQWRGPEDGLPPAGTVCECFHTDFGWTECDVIGPYGDYVVCAPKGGGFYGYDAHELRPIRTEEDKTVEDAMIILGAEEGDHSSVSGIVRRMIAAGYRKQDNLE